MLHPKPGSKTKWIEITNKDNHVSHLDSDNLRQTLQLPRLARVVPWPGKAAARCTQWPLSSTHSCAMHCLIMTISRTCWTVSLICTILQDIYWARGHYWGAARRGAAARAARDPRWPCTVHTSQSHWSRLVASSNVTLLSAAFARRISRGVS